MELAKDECIMGFKEKHFGKKEKSQYCNFQLMIRKIDETDKKRSDDVVYLRNL